jgi:hypothetical protein
MKRFLLLPVAALLATACSDQPTKEESLKIFTATTSLTSTAQSAAVTVARNDSAGNGSLALDYSGPCLLAGTVGVQGSYTGTGSDNHAVFDLSTTFTGCRDFAGTLDGDLNWTSTADPNGFSADMTGSLDWSSDNNSATCDFDLHLAVNSSSVRYDGSLCGYLVSELGLSVGP